MTTARITTETRSWYTRGGVIVGHVYHDHLDRVKDARGNRAEAEGANYASAAQVFLILGNSERKNS